MSGPLIDEEEDDDREWSTRAPPRLGRGLVAAAWHRGMAIGEAVWCLLCGCRQPNALISFPCSFALG